jgi:hypothetical protein
MCICAHLDVKNVARKGIGSWAPIQRQNLTKDPESIEDVRKVFAQDIADYSANVFKGICDRLGMFGSLLDRRCKVSCTLIVVGMSTTLLVEKMGVNICRSTVTLGYELTKKYAGK